MYLLFFLLGMYILPKNVQGEWWLERGYTGCPPNKGGKNTLITTKKEELAFSKKSLRKSIIFYLANFLHIPPPPSPPW